MIRLSATDKIQPSIDICDDSLSYLLSNLIGIEKIASRWVESREWRAAMAMFNHSWNHLLAARMLVLSGYTSEAFLLLRESLDATAKAHLFHNSAEWTGRFFAGKQISASVVRNAIREMYETGSKSSEGSTVTEYLTDQYTRLSRLGHSNMDALKHRTGGVDRAKYATDPKTALSEALGLDVTRGGMPNLYWVGFGLQEVAHQALVGAQLIITLNSNKQAEYRAEINGLLERVNEDRLALQQSIRNVSERKRLKVSTTAYGYVNRNGQRNLGRAEPARRGTDHKQYVYVIRCDKCGQNYGANGSDIWQRKCPSHQSGSSGLELTTEETEWK